MRGLWEAWRTIVLADLGLRRTDASDDLLVEFRQLFSPARLGPFLTELGVDQNGTVARYVQRLVRSVGVQGRREFPVPRDLVEAFRTRNLALIKSLGDEHVRDLQRTLRPLQEQGATVDTIRNEISKRVGVGGRRAMLLARDQTNKLNSQLQATQQQAAGIEEFIWSTSQDGDVRESHERLHGRRFSYANPPVVDGEAVLPGEPILCRCQALPVINLFEGI
jgi:SPP1 gp7 family putative phage head morphogenesis protein